MCKNQAFRWFCGEHWFANYLEAHLGFDPISISPIKIVAMGTVSLRKSQELSLSLLGSPICEAQAELRYVLTSYAGWSSK
jgi:hypothetical protein